MNSHKNNAFTSFKTLARMLYAFNTCVDFIRTVPAQQHDPFQAEDIDTNGEDHAADEARYACMSRPFVRALPRDRSKIETRLPTLDELYAHRDKEHRAGRI